MVRVEILCNGKCRIFFNSKEPCRLLLSYMTKGNVTNSSVFVTRNNNPLDRSNVWRNTKKLCDAAHSSPKKMLPNNLHHLFAITFQAIEKNVVRISDVFGRSNIFTTHIYTMYSGKEHLRQVYLMNSGVLFHKNNLLFYVNSVVFLILNLCYIKPVLLSNP